MFNLLWNKPKPDRFSLENLKALCEQLQHFSADANEESIIGCLKELTQLLIWGDQHDPLLLEHFFEQNVHFHFLKILQSKQDGSLIIQVLQTLNIMFENVRSQESLYFLLSNNYVNQVIGVRYDFSNDEILAYYIYLLRTLSFKLSKDTIYFFFNEHLDDFPLYSEAIKFFNHEESMIRIAVRVITLNVYSVDDKQMQEFILDRTTTTYFSNLVWFIGNYGTTVNDMLLHPGEGEFSRMNYYLAEHMDCFYYVNDIIELEVPKINKILISHLLNRLLRPMYLDSILPPNAVKNGSSSSSGTKSSSASQKLAPLVALSLMLHAFHVLKHAPLVSALTSTLFSNQHYSNNSTAHHPHTRHGPSPLSLGPLPPSPDTSRPSSPVTSKFHSFGLLGTSPGLDSTLSSVHAPTPQARVNYHHTMAPAQHISSSDNQQQNPYKTAIFEYLSRIDNDRLVLPALTLIYLTGRNPGVMQDVLLGTDIYPQRLLKTRLLMGNLMSSTSPSKGGQGATPMSRERSADSIVSNQSLGSNSTGTWLPSPGQNIPTSITGSLFGPAGSAARMRSRTESPLFETEEDDQESRETEELLASEASRQPSPPTSSTKAMLSTSLPTTSGFSAAGSMSRNHSADGEELRQPKLKSSRRRGSKASSILAPIIPSTSDESLKSRGVMESTQIEQELKPVSTSKADRALIDIYPSAEEDDLEEGSNMAPRQESELDSDVPPPLPPRPAPEASTGDLETILESTKLAQPEFVVQNREELIGRLFDILCGRPESGAHRFRMYTIQMAAELLIEFVSTKVGPAMDNKDHPKGSASHNSGASSSSSSAIENQLGEARLSRLALAEAQFRGRVQKGIRRLEKMKMRQGGGHGSGSKQPLGLLTGRVERALSESSLGIERQIVNIISESSIIYGPDRDLEKELDLDPTQELIALFDLDPEHTDMSHEKQERLHEQDRAQRDHEDSTPPTSSGSTSVSGRESRRSRMRTKIKVKMQGATTFTGEKPATDISFTTAASSAGDRAGGHLGPMPTKPSMELRLEAMVIRYVKWLHLLIQCRQLLCRKAASPATGLVGSPLPPTVTTTSVSAKPGTTALNLGSPTLSINSALTPTPLERRPSDLLAGSAGAVVSAHKGLQKALATTATTTAIASPLDPTANASLPTVEVEGPLTVVSAVSSPSTTVHSAGSSPSSSASTSTSSLSSMTSSPVPSAVASSTFSQPAMGTASSSRTLLTATAALEAASAAHNHQHQANHEGGSGAASGSGGATSINEMISLHLDPLSASVSEAFRKSSARIRKSVVDPLAAASPLFRTSSSNSAVTSSSLSVNDAVAHKGFYRPPSAVSSAASSVVSLNKPSGSMMIGADGERMTTPMQRSRSNSSSSTSHSGRSGARANAGAGGVTAASIRSVGGGSVSNTRTSEDQTTLRDDVLGTTTLSKKKIEGLGDEEGEEKTEEGEGVAGFQSILDPGYPTYEADENVQKILATLGLL